MKYRLSAGVGIALLTTAVALTAQTQVPVPPSSAARPVPSHSAPTSAESQTAVIKQYCVTCHNDRAKTGGLSLASFDAGRAAEHPEVVEKMIRKLRVGMMPPAGGRRPAPEVLSGLLDCLENRVDTAAAAAPNPGWRPFQRLNRAEYARAIKDLLDGEIDGAALLVLAAQQEKDLRLNRIPLPVTVEV